MNKEGWKLLKSAGTDSSKKKIEMWESPHFTYYVWILQGNNKIHEFITREQSDANGAFRQFKKQLASDL